MTIVSIIPIQGLASPQYNNYWNRILYNIENKKGRVGTTKGFTPCVSLTPPPPPMVVAILLRNGLRKAEFYTIYYIATSLQRLR